MSDKEKIKENGQIDEDNMYVIVDFGDPELIQKNDYPKELHGMIDEYKENNPLVNLESVIFTFMIPARETKSGKKETIIFEFKREAIQELSLFTQERSSLSELHLTVLLTRNAMAFRDRYVSFTNGDLSNIGYSVLLLYDRIIYKFKGERASYTNTPIVDTQGEIKQPSFPIRIVERHVNEDGKFKSYMTISVVMSGLQYYFKNEMEENESEDQSSKGTS